MRRWEIFIDFNIKIPCRNKKTVKHSTRTIILTIRIISTPLNVYLMTMGVTVWTFIQYRIKYSNIWIYVSPVEKTVRDTRSSQLILVRVPVER